MILFLSILVLLTKLKISKSSFGVLLSFIFFYMWSLARIIPEIKIMGSIPIVVVLWGSVAFLMLIASNVSQDELKNRLILEKTFWLATWVYLIVMAFQISQGQKDPATAQAAVALFSFHYVRVLHGKKNSMFPLILIFLSHILMTARIVVLSDLIILFAGGCLVYGFSWFFKPRKPYLLALLVILLSVKVFYYSNFIDKTIGGDVALKIGNYSINTSGRLFVWDKVVRSAMDSIWVGHGIPITEDMIGLPSWSHPHNDYLRILHQSGILGLILWLVFLLNSIICLIKGGTINMEWRNITILTMISFSIFMFTDNCLAYSYVFFPMAILIGLFCKKEKQRKTNFYDLAIYQKG